NPGSAATVTGVVCDAVAASGDPTRSRWRKTFANEPDPNPQTGRCTNIDRPARISFARPLEDVFSDWWLAFTCTLPRPASAIAPAAIAPTRTTATTARGYQRSAASRTRPTKSAAKLVSENVRISPAQMNASAARHTATSRVRRAHSSTAASPSITIARKRPQMFGSKNSELTLKYDWK